MNAALRKIVESKQSYRQKLAARPLAEKLSMSEQLSERALLTRQVEEKTVPKAPWEIPKHWRWARMGDPNVADVVGGGTPRTDRADYFGGEIPWITPADLSKYTHKTISCGARNITEEGLANSGARLLPAGTVLFSSRAPIGYVAIAANSVSTNQGFKSFILKDILLPDFVYYYLQRAKNLAVALASGTTFLEISGKNAARLPIPIPPLPEQKKIVAEIEKQFTRLDAGVAALKRVQANLKRYRASVLKAACEGKLVPTEAALARMANAPDSKSGASIVRTRRADALDSKSSIPTSTRADASNLKLIGLKNPVDFEPGAALLERILADRRQNWQGRGKYKEPVAASTANLPKLPDGWCWSRLEQLGTTYGGLTKNPKRSKLPKQLPYLRVANVYANELRLEEIEYIGIEDSELEKLLLQVGDLLIVEGNGSKSQIGRLAIWDGSIKSCVHQNHIIKVRLVDVKMSKWILYWLQSYEGRHFVELVASSTSGLYTLSVNKVGDLPIPLPPLAEQKRIVAEVERRLSVVEELAATVTANLLRAARLRQAILQKAFCGELI
jgi:type I restriction enzyme, S subunit